MQEGIYVFRKILRIWKSEEKLPFNLNRYQLCIWNRKVSFLIGKFNIVFHTQNGFNDPLMGHNQTVFRRLFQYFVFQSQPGCFNPIAKHLGALAIWDNAHHRRGMTSIRPDIFRLPVRVSSLPGHRYSLHASRHRIRLGISEHTPISPLSPSSSAILSTPAIARAK